MPTPTIIQAWLFPGVGEMCRHCGDVEKPTRRRGLCLACYNRPDIRCRYRQKKPSGTGAMKDKSGFIPMPLKPTNYLPGTFQKTHIMRLRLSLGLALHHPQDCFLDNGGLSEDAAQTFVEAFQRFLDGELEELG